MAKFTSKAGVVVEAHVVSEQEKTLTARVEPGGHEHFGIGDALVTLPDGKQYALRAPLNHPPARRIATIHRPMN